MICKFTAMASTTTEIAKKSMTLSFNDTAEIFKIPLLHGHQTKSYEKHGMKQGAICRTTAEIMDSIRYNQTSENEAELCLKLAKDLRHEVLTGEEPPQREIKAGTVFVVDTGAGGHIVTLEEGMELEKGPNTMVQSSNGTTTSDSMAPSTYLTLAPSLDSP